MLICLSLDFSVLHSLLWIGWTTAALKSWGKVPSVRQGWISFRGKSTMRFVNYFITLISLSLSWVTFFMSSRFIFFEISSLVSHVKEKVASFSKLDTNLPIIDILGYFWYSLIALSARSKILKTFLSYC